MANTKVSKKDLETWVEAVAYNTIKGEEITPEDVKRLDNIGKKTANLSDITRVIQEVAYVSTLDLNEATQKLFNIMDVIMIVLNENLGVTEEQFEKASQIRKDKVEEYIKSKQEELRKHQEETHVKEDYIESEEATEESVEEAPKQDNVIQFTPKGE